MTTIVSVSDFRKNLSDYLDSLMRGERVIIENAKKRKKRLVLKAEKEEEFDWDEYVRFVESLKGSGLLTSKKDEEARARFRKSLDRRFALARKR